MFKTERLLSLEGVRVFAFIMVMLAHTGISVLSIRGLGGGVSLFLILNGFLMAYSYYNKFDNIFNEIGIKNNFFFSIKKLRKLYPLHIITMLMMILFNFIGPVKNFIKAFVTIFLNTLLIDEWFPLSYSIRFANGVSWFLCSLLLAYFLFPYVLKKIRSFSTKQIYLRLVCALIIQVLVGIIGSRFPELPFINDAILDNRLTVWLVYYFPLTRFVDIYIGYNLGVLFIKIKEHEKEYIYRNNDFIISLVEILSVILFIVAMIIANLARANAEVLFPNYNHPNLWWSYTAIFTIPSIMLIYLFAEGKGIVSKIIKKSIFTKIADISAYGFLIHYVVFQYITKFVLHFNNESAIMNCLNNNISYVLLIIGVPMTLLLSWCWKNVPSLIFSDSK